MSNTDVKPHHMRGSRLAAVQAVYQMHLNKGQDAKSTVKEYLEDRAGLQIDGDEYVTPDKALFSKIVQGLSEKEREIGEIVFHALSKENETPKEIEPLLKAILYCGAYECQAHGDIDLPLIINDYIEVTKAFYNGSEKKLVNAVLDRIGKTLRI